MFSRDEPLVGEPDWEPDWQVDLHEPQECIDWFENKGVSHTVTVLAVGDYVYKGKVAFERKKASGDFSNFADTIAKCNEMLLTYEYPYLIVEGTLQDAITAVTAEWRKGKLLAPLRAMVASLCVRGMAPIFCGDKENMFDVMSRIADKHFDGKDRTPKKRVGKTRGAKVRLPRDEGESRKMTTVDYEFSLIASLPNIDSGKAKALLGHFGSARKILDADKEQLMTCPGIGPTIADKITSITRGDNMPLYLGEWMVRREVEIGKHVEFQDRDLKQRIGLVTAIEGKIIKVKDGKTHDVLMDRVIQIYDRRENGEQDDRSDANGEIPTEDTGSRFGASWGN